MERRSIKKKGGLETYGFQKESSMYKKNRMNILNIGVMIIIFLIGLLLGISLSSQTVSVYNYPPQPIIEQQVVPESLIAYNISLASINVPAVDSEGNGVATKLLVQVMPGSGRTLTNIDKLLFWVDTQHSIRTAKSVAQNLTRMDLSKYDLIYTIQANATVIGGPSAGAALTIATIAALENKKINDSVMITGTINHDGSIGPVGEILPKANASKDIGAEIFLVPLTQSIQVTYKTIQHCEKIGWVDFCTTETIPEKVDVAEAVGIEVKEVGNIEEALKYFIE